MLTVVPSVDDPQRHPYRVWLCEDDIVAVVVAFDNGTSVTNLVSTTVPMPWTVAFTRPLASVCTPLTYFVCCETVRTSHPQPLAAGGVAGPDWYTSVIDVRHELIARITSDILARIV